MNLDEEEKTKNDEYVTDMFILSMNNNSRENGGLDQRGKCPFSESMFVLVIQSTERERGRGRGRNAITHHQLRSVSSDRRIVREYRHKLEERFFDYDERVRATGTSDGSIDLDQCAFGTK